MNLIQAYIYIYGKIYIKQKKMDEIIYVAQLEDEQQQQHGSMSIEPSSQRVNECCKSMCCTNTKYRENNNNFHENVTYISKKRKE